jgi:hypothetical protein
MRVTRLPRPRTFAGWPRVSGGRGRRGACGRGGVCLGLGCIERGSIGVRPAGVRPAPHWPLGPVQVATTGDLFPIRHVCPCSAAQNAGSVLRLTASCRVVLCGSRASTASPERTFGRDTGLAQDWLGMSKHLGCSYASVMAGVRLRDEEVRYRKINEGHREHFAAMGVPVGSVGVAAAARPGVSMALEHYSSAVQLPIARVLASRDAASLIAVAEAAAP